MHVVRILVAAMTLGLAGGYAWSWIAPAAPAATAATPAPAKARAIAAKPRKAAQPTDELSAEDREWAARASTSSPVPGPASAARARQVEQSIYYRGCNDARAAGVAPIYAGQSGYREGLDGDSDGVACEPYYGSG